MFWINKALTLILNLLILTAFSVATTALYAQVEVEPDIIKIKLIAPHESFMAITNAGDTGGYDLSLYNQSDYVINETNISPRLVIQKGGNVGIGDNLIPTAALHVITSSEGTPDKNGIHVSNLINEIGQRAIISARVAGSEAGDPFLSFEIKDGPGWALGIDNSDEDKFKIASHWSVLDGPDTKMTIQKDGNLGVGTSTPSQRLDVDGRARIRDLPSGPGDFVVADVDGNLMRGGMAPAGVKSGKALLDLKTDMILKDKRLDDLSSQNESLARRINELEVIVKQLLESN